jgi:hypothetical protein
MTYLTIQIAIGKPGVTRVTALGRTGEDRSEALDFLTKIDRELRKIDQQAKSSAKLQQ